MLKSVKLLFSLFVINIKSRAMLRAEFLLRCTLMILNNFISLITWFVIFKTYKSINGWNFQDFLVALGIVNISFGFNDLFFTGIRKIPQWVQTGRFDVFFIYPKNVLFMVSASDSDPWGFSNILTGIILIILSGFFSLTNVIPILLFCLLGTIFVYSATVLFATLAFWMRDSENIFRHICLNFQVLSTNPSSIYHGALKFFIWTLLPIALITQFSLSFLKTLNPCYLIGACLGIGVFFTTSLWFFFFSLKRYESGNLFIVRTT